MKKFTHGPGTIAKKAKMNRKLIFPESGEKYSKNTVYDLTRRFAGAIIYFATFSVEISARMCMHSEHSDNFKRSKQRVAVQKHT